jgi:YbbR domain-containing protein
VSGGITGWLRGILAENPGTKLISVVIAVLLWFVVLGSRNTEVAKEVPLQIVTAPNVAIASDTPDRVVFRLSGPGAFLRTILDRRDDPIRVDLTGTRSGQVTYRFFSDSIHLPIGVQVQNINPPSITVQLEELKIKRVPVKVDLQGLPPEGFSILNTDVEPQEIEVRGPESHVAQVTELRTQPIDVSGAKHGFERKASFELKRLGVQLNGDAPMVRVAVAATSANFRIKNVPVKIKTSLRYRLRIKEVTVLVRASREDMDALDEAQVYAEADLSGKPAGRYEGRLRVYVPDNIALVKSEPESVSVVLY